MELRQYQARAVQEIRAEYISGKTAPLFVLPTGGGKTVLFTYVAKSAADKGNKVLILVHRVELLRQTAATLKKFGVHCGLISPKFRPDYTASVQVGSVQTVINRLDKFTPGLIIIDEAHHATAGTWRKTIAAYPKARVLGVTATPIRGDGKGLGKDFGGLFDCMVQGPQMGDLIEMGFLVKPRIIEPSILIDRATLHTKMGDFDKKESAQALDKPQIIGDVVSNYRKFAHKRPAVAFCVNVAHAHHVAEAFKANGYKAEAVDGKMDDSDRQRILAGLGNGQIDVVTSCDLIGEGVDIPAIGAAILLRPTKSKGLYLQQVGRALRTSQGKTDAFIIDHVGNVQAHGLPQQIQEWSLEGETKKKRKKQDQETAIRLVTCKSCYTSQPPASHCEICGEALGKPRELKQTAGELLELTDEQIAERLAKKQAKQKAKREEAQAQTLPELRALAKARGYKAGWAEYRFKARQKYR